MPNSPYALIPLSRGEFAKVDPERHAELSQWFWSVNPTRSGFYAHRQVREGGKTRKEYMHRRIAGAGQGEYVDHINGDRADNRIDDLLAANRSENQCNRSALSSNTSGYPGVSWHKKSGSWAVRLMKNGKTHALGYFKDLELAGLVSKEARAKFHGQFAHQSLKQRIAALEGTQP